MNDTLLERHTHFACPVQSYCTGACDVARQGLAGFYRAQEKKMPVVLAQ